MGRKGHRAAALGEIIVIGVLFAVLCNFVLLRVLRSCIAASSPKP